MEKNETIQIRLGGEFLARVDAMAEAIKLPRSVLVRVLLESMVESFEMNGQKITLPIRVIGKDDLPWVEQQRDAFEKKMREQTP